ncbi:DUF402 domain-containing protein [Cytobacillus spongiae]|jgi:protein associated with RNAse G/E|uniref:DUF402 domain-containing protein n=1 Tax=Cytobacillus spongiae TaxID=2901381 RepID=UPI001F239D92|nr:DUF402 domain-containing protein [Cytobacillus spongiae]UII54729.1 DUF402 domain-containing protein [Cytobacillus spongiae]
MNQGIKITALKYPNIPHYEWQGEVVRKTEDGLFVLCCPGRKLHHYSKGATFTINNVSLEYYSFKDWFTAAMEIENGRVVSYYCNIAMPSKMISNHVSFVDLDLDFVMSEQTGWQVVDEEEFEENSIKFEYSAELKKAAFESLEELKDRVRKKQFPFNENSLAGIHIDDYLK